MITITKATLTDKTTLLDLMQKQFSEHAIICPADLLESAIAEMLVQSVLGFFLLAKENNNVVGFAAISFAWTLEHGGKSAWLDELYVLTEHRNKGIGGLLIERVVAEAHKAGCKAIDLEVEVEHSRAARLYQRKGFEKLERTRWVKKLS